MEILLTKEEFDHIYCSVRDAFKKVTLGNNRLNSFGNDSDMIDEKELYIYVKLLKDYKSYYCLDDFNSDDMYPNILSIKDILKIHNRSLEIAVNFK